MKIKGALCALLATALTFLFISFSEAAVTVNISPGGTLSYVNNVKVKFTYTFGETAQTAIKKIESFTIRFNGQDLTQSFLNAADIKLDSNVAAAEIEYLFEPGTYTFSSTIKLKGEQEVFASTTFTVPGDDQIRRKNTVLSRLSLFMYQWNTYNFSIAY